MKCFLPISICVLLSCICMAQTDNPIGETIEPSGISIKLEDLTTIQSSSSSDPKARINLLRELPDESGRFAIIDLRGILWLRVGEVQVPFLKIKDHTNTFIDAPGKGTGFGAFDFHPNYSENGLFYTSHAEQASSSEADFVPAEFDNIALQWVIREWKIDAPTQDIFTGSYREIFRMDFPSALHGVQDVQFNPSSIEGDDDFGLLYICVGDGGSSLHFLEENLGSFDSFLGSIFRIDPLGNNSSNGQYGIPDSNPFLNGVQGLPEVYALGFRNPHRICWDPEDRELMLIGDIGEKNIEEVNLGIAGANYGWGKREGTFAYYRELGREFVYPLPDDEDSYNYTYPIAQFDHDEGVAIVGGFVYRGDHKPELYGHYIFGDIPSGRLFHFPVSDIPDDGSLLEIKELLILDENESLTDYLEITQSDRADLRFGQDRDGEMYFLTKADGKVKAIRQLPSQLEGNPVLSSKISIFPNPNNGVFRFIVDESFVNDPFYLYSSDGELIISGKIQSVETSLEVSNLTPGSYILKVGKEAKLHSLNVILQE